MLCIKALSLRAAGDLSKADALAVFFLYILAYFAFGLIAAALEADALFLQCAFTLTVGALPFLYAALRRIPFKAFFCLKRPSAAQVLGALLCMAGASILAGLAQIASSLILGGRAGKGGQRLDALLSSYPPPLLFVASAALPAFCEEALFRGFVLSSLRKRPNAPAGFKEERRAILASAALFALAHADPARLAPSFIAGLAISYATCATGSLVVAMLMHIFNNSASLILYFALPLKTTEDAASWLAALPAAAPLAIACVAAGASVALIAAGRRGFRA